MTTYFVGGGGGLGRCGGRRRRGHCGGIDIIKKAGASIFNKSDLATTHSC